MILVYSMCFIGGALAAVGDVYAGLGAIITLLAGITIGNSNAP